MNEQKVLRTQLFKYIKTNIIIFVVVFIIFGIFISVFVRNIVYSSVDNELKENISILSNVLKELESFEYSNKNKEINELQEYTILSNISNPKLICIIRNDDGKILCTNINFISNNTFKDFKFDDNKIDKYYVVDVNGKYFYKGITVDLSEITDNTTGYVQFYLNIDAERKISTNYQLVIIWSIYFGIAISIIASIVISRRSIEPVATMIKKQEEFVQNVSHELRTPLTIIQAKQELLLGDPNAKIIDKIEDISISLNETKRMSKMTKDLMMLSRGDTKQMELNKEAVEIDELIENIGKTYSEIINIQEKKLNLDLNFNKKIYIDTNKIYQVIVILLDNAMKYTEKRR